MKPPPKEIEITLCTVCHDDIPGTKYTVVMENGKSAYHYHDHCLPQDVRRHLESNGKDQPRGPLPL